MENLKLKGIVNYKVFDKDWNLKSDTTDTNLIVNAGIAESIKRIGGITANAFTYLAIGSSSTAVDATQTALVSELTTNGWERKSATVTAETTTVAWDTLQLVANWTFTWVATMNEVWVFNAVSWWVMLGRQVPNVKNFDADETLQITYKIILS